MAEIETRELEYFVAVAEELHYARAAERLHIAQPALSRAIQRLESRLGVVLLDRDSRHVALTPAGDALLYHARQVLEAVSRASSTARAVDRQSLGLRLVVKPGGDSELIPEILGRWEKDRSAPHVDVLFGGLTDRVDHLRDGRADLAILYDPLDDLSGLEFRVLLTEEMVAVLPAGHRLARRRQVTSDDLEGETRARWRGLIREGDGPEVSSMSEFALVVALGRAIAVLPRSTVTLLSDRAICVPVADLPPTRTVIAWVAANARPEVQAFALIAQRVAQRVTRRGTRNAPINEPAG